MTLFEDKAGRAVRRQQQRLSSPRRWSSRRNSATEYATLPNVIKAKDMPWERSPDGLIKHLVNQKMQTRECCIEAYMQFLKDGERSGKHRHMWEELFFVVEGSGYDLHWDLKWDCLEAFEWQWADEPRKFEWTVGDYVYIPPFTMHQHFANAGRGMPHHRDEQPHRQRHGLRLVRSGRARAGILTIVRRSAWEPAEPTAMVTTTPERPLWGRRSAARAAACRAGLSSCHGACHFAAGRRVRRRAVLALCPIRKLPASISSSKTMRTNWRSTSIGICRARSSPWRRWRPRTRWKAAITPDSTIAPARQGARRGRHARCAAATGNSLPNTRVPWGTPLPRDPDPEDEKAATTGETLCQQCRRGSGRRPSHLFHQRSDQRERRGCLLSSYEHRLGATRRPAPLRDRPRTDRRHSGSRQCGLGAHRGIRASGSASRRRKASSTRSKATQGTWLGNNIQGYEIRLGYARSKLSGWLVWVGVPDADDSEFAASGACGA